MNKQKSHYLNFIKKLQTKQKIIQYCHVMDIRIRATVSGLNLLNELFTTLNIEIIQWKFIHLKSIKQSNDLDIGYHSVRSFAAQPFIIFA